MRRVPVLPLVFLLLPAAAPAQWHSTDLGIESAEVRAFAIAPSQPATVYASLTGLGIRRSDDRGGTWVAASGGLPVDASFGSVVVAPGDPDRVYAGQATAAGATIWRTDDGGQSWAQAATGFAAEYLTDLLVWPQDPGIVLASASGTGGALWRTSDAGASWSVVLPTPSQSIRDLAHHPADPDLILGATEGGVWRTIDGGDNWTLRTGNPGTFQALAFSGDGPWSVYARDSQGRLFRSDDLGLDFTEISVPPTDDLWLSSLAGHPADDLKLLAAGTGYGCIGFNYSREYVWETTDGGASWSDTFVDPDCNSGYPTGVAYDPVDPSHVYLSERTTEQRGFRHSSDGGTTFVTRVDGLRNFRIATVRGDLAGTNYTRWLEFLLRSDGSLDTWTNLGQKPFELVDFWDGSFEVNLTTPGLLFEAAGGVAGDIAFHYLNRSTDGGVTWDPGAANPPGIPQPEQVLGAISNHGGGARVYAFTWDKLYRSDNGGSTYTEVPPSGALASVLGFPDPPAVVIDPGNDLRLFVAAGTEVLLSVDGGSSFESRSAGLPVSGGAVRHLFLRRSDPDYLQAVFSDGRVFETSSAGVGWELRFGLDLGGGAVDDATWDEETGHVFLAVPGTGVVSSHPKFEPAGLPTTKIESVHFSPAQGALLVGTTHAGLFHQFVAPPVAAPLGGGAESVRLGIFPNPSAAESRLAFVVPPAGARVRLSVHDASGRRVRELLARRLPGGPRSAAWDGRDGRGARVPAGVYFVRLEIDGRWTGSKAVRIR